MDKPLKEYINYKLLLLENSDSTVTTSSLVMPRFIANVQGSAGTGKSYVINIINKLTCTVMGNMSSTMYL